MRERIVAGNWKMHGSRDLVRRWAGSFRAGTGSTTVLLMPPAVLLPAFVDACGDGGVEFGVQTVHPEPEGAFTGEISAEMAADAGAGWTLIGHSERRLYQHEDDAAVAARFAAARRAGLRPVLCVGESLEQRQAGCAGEVVLRQLHAVTQQAGTAFSDAVVAYEPVWAIGTGETASPEQAQEMHALLRDALRRIAPGFDRLPLLYGGSVKPDNAAALFAQPDVDGGLVGGASLDAAAFEAIVAASDAG